MLPVQEVKQRFKNKNTPSPPNLRMTFEPAQAGENPCVDYLLSWVLILFFFFFLVFFGPKNIQRLKLE